MACYDTMTVNINGKTGINIHGQSARWVTCQYAGFRRNHCLLENSTSSSLHPLAKLRTQILLTLNDKFPPNISYKHRVTGHPIFVLPKRRHKHQHDGRTNLWRENNSKTMTSLTVVYSDKDWKIWNLYFFNRNEENCGSMKYFTMQTVTDKPTQHYTQASYLYCNVS